MGPRLYSKWMKRWFSLGVKDMTSLGGVCVCSVVSDSLQPHGLYSLPGSSVHGILHCPLDSPFSTGILDWVAIFSSRASSSHRDQTCVCGVPRIGRWILDDQCHLGSPQPLSLGSNPSAATFQLGSRVSYLTSLCFCFLI